MSNWPGPQKVAAEHVLKAIHNPIDWDSSALREWVTTHPLDEVVVLIGASITVQADLARKYYRDPAGAYEQIIRDYENADEIRITS